MLALYAGASSDHNPVHIDSDFARRAGLPDVFAHGMLSMAYLGRFLTDWIPQSRIRRFSVRFVSRVELGAALLCSGEILDINEHDGERLARVEVRVTGEAGELKVIGEACVALAPVAGTRLR
ncbi:MaoC/PaaZ C-terminal domain-containing protein [Pseudomonas sp. NPDC077186]|uniref:MaoC/PaaZ C-terminal domain-containing protein n=1 Tax=Pseudomonas TaxID=286 RepID=UPI000E29090C|nr:MaoC/PaaZ C-terminal domain-containing protein [Pseudomonas aeruginosa]AXL70930.1 (R)-specific enoyl-CoA hydratase [Pseudomonas aeruginosa]